MHTHDQEWYGPCHVRGGAVRPSAQERRPRRARRASPAVRRENVARYLTARLNKDGRGTRVEIHPLNQSRVDRPHQRAVEFRSMSVCRRDRIVAVWATDDDQELDDAWVDQVVDLGSQWPERVRHQRRVRRLRARDGPWPAAGQDEGQGLSATGPGHDREANRGPSSRRCTRRVEANAEPGRMVTRGSTGCVNPPGHSRRSVTSPIASSASTTTATTHVLAATLHGSRGRPSAPR